MNHKPLLTIGIPTYNRARFLQECLDSIKAAMELSGFQEQIEIIVSDNASTDNTREIVSNFQAPVPNLQYFRNLQNLEFDGNVINVLRHCRGQWCWLMSDDEIMESGALQFLRPLLEGRPEVSYICVNHGGLPQVREIEYYKNGAVWLEHFGLAGGLLSQNIFRMSSLPIDIEKYWGNFWPHFSIALEVMGRHGALLVKNLFREPQEPRKSRFFKPDQVIHNYVSLYGIVKNLPALGYPFASIKKILKGLARGLPRIIVTAKLLGSRFSVSNVKLLTRTYSTHRFWLFLALLTYIIPVSVLKSAKSLKVLF